MAHPAAEAGTPAKGRNPDKASVPAGSNASGKGGKKKGKGSASIFEIDALNPPFDTRMRRIGSPLNQTSKIKRGWIQSAEDPKRVNFLFNPPSIDVTSAVFNEVRLDEQIPASDVMSQDIPAMGTTTGVTLLYDRTYELFSPPKSGDIDFANKYGVWADVAAWYVYLGMLEEMPDSWENSMMTNAMHRVSSFLFVGPRLCYYGYPTSIGVTYSHWTQNMIPARCAVNLGFEILPYNGPTPYQGMQDISIDVLPGVGWAGDWTFHPDGTVTDDSPLATGSADAGSGVTFLDIPFTNPDD